MNSYTVYFTAQLRDGFKRSDAIRMLGETFSLDLERVKQLLSTAPKAVKREVAKPQANKIIQALWQGGWHSELYLNDKKVYSTDESQTESVALASPVSTEVPLKNEGVSHTTPIAPVVGSEPEAESLRSERLLRLTATDQSCSVCVPERWLAMQQLNPNACLQAGCIDTDSYLVVIPQLKMAINRQVSLQEYTEAVIESAIGWVEEGGVIAAATPHRQLELATVCGEIEGVVGGNRVHYLISVYEQQDVFYACYLWSEAAAFERQRPLFQALLASFRIH